MQEKIIQLSKKELRKVNIGAFLNLCVFDCVSNYETRKKKKVIVSKVTRNILCVKDDKGTFIFDFKKCSSFGKIPISQDFIVGTEVNIVEGSEINFWNIKNVFYSFEAIPTTRFQFINNSK